MTAAIRQQRKRDRAKSGLVRIEAWVPADKAEYILDVISAANPERGPGMRILEVWVERDKFPALQEAVRAALRDIENNS